MKKIGISTDIGYNYGSMLQAYATLRIIKDLGYEGVVFRPGGSLVKRKDIRPGKLFTTAFRMVLHSKNLKNSIKSFTSTYSKIMSDGTEDAMTAFLDAEISPIEKTISQLKRVGKNDDYQAFICGSDQIWITDSYYIDPFYYLSYAPEYKRIAWAPSFGREFVPEYNRKAIAKKIKTIPYLSVREQSGESIIQQLTNKEAKVLVDPTLVLNGEQWRTLSNSNNESSGYLLAYFLDMPSDTAVNFMKEYVRKHNLKIVGVPYIFSEKYSDIVPKSIGPFEFVNLIANAEVIFTDSFHGTAFSLNLRKSFYTFGRNYGAAVDQSTRIKSILKLTNTENRFCTGNHLDDNDLDFDCIQNVLSAERRKALDYLRNAVNGVKNYG